MSAASERVAALLRTRRHDEAARLAAELLPSHPDDIPLRLNAAIAMSGAGEGAAAIEMVDSALRDWPEIAEVHRIASTIHSHLGDHRQAYDAALRAVQIDPEEASNQVQLAFAAAGRPGITGAHRVGRTAGGEAVRLAPDEPEAHFALGMVHLAMQAPKRALPCFEEAVRLDPNEAAYHQQLAAVLQKLGRTHEAGEHMLAAGRANPTDDAPIKGLRKLSKSAVVPGVAIVVLVVAMRAAIVLTGQSDAVADSSDGQAPSWALIIVFAVIGLSFWLFIRRMRTSSWAERRGKAISPEARKVVETDKQIRKGRKR